MTLDVDHRSPPAPDGRALGFASRGLPRLSIVIPAIAVDAAALATLSTLVGVIYYNYVLKTPAPLLVHIQLGAIIALSHGSIASIQGSYRLETLTELGNLAGRLANSLLVGLFLLLALMFMTKSNEAFSRTVVAMSFGLGLVTLWAVRRLFISGVNALIARSVITRGTAFLIGQSHQLGIVRGDIEKATGGAIDLLSIPFKSRIDDPGFIEDIALIRQLARAHMPDRIVICLPWSEGATVGACIDALVELPVAIHARPEMPEDAFPTEYIWSIHGPWGLTLAGKPLRAEQAAIKRAFDFIGAAAGIALLSPLLILIALLIRIDSPGPVFFSQRRYGLNRHPFTMYKFRSMRQSASTEPFRQAKRGDDRITRLGRLLRRTSLDELPQLFNVLKGDMSLVGPRPHPMELDEAYHEQISYYSVRHRIRPGITGWAQVNGFRGETSTIDQMKGRIQHDLHYLNNWSFWLDVQIVLRTVFTAKPYRLAV